MAIDAPEKPLRGGSSNCLSLLVEDEVFKIAAMDVQRFPDALLASLYASRENPCSVVPVGDGKPISLDGATKATFRWIMEIYRTGRISAASISCEDHATKLHQQLDYFQLPSLPSLVIPKAGNPTIHNFIRQQHAERLCHSILDLMPPPGTLASEVYLLFRWEHTPANGRRGDPEATVYPYICSSVEGMNYLLSWEKGTGRTDCRIFAAKHHSFSHHCRHIQSPLSLFVDAERCTLESKLPGGRLSAARVIDYSAQSNYAEQWLKALPHTLVKLSGFQSRWHTFAVTDCNADSEEVLRLRLLAVSLI